MGSGKSAIGRMLARSLGVGFKDLDHWVEQKTRMPIPKIFEVKGERFFRNKEREGIRVLTRRSSLILATGGGAWMDPLNRRRLGRWGTVVWLKVKFSTVWKRVSPYKSQRPLVGRSKGPSPKFVKLFRMRQKVYAKAKIVVHTDDRTPSQSCKLVVKKLKEIELPV